MARPLLSGHLSQTGFILFCSWLIYRSLKKVSDHFRSLWPSVRCSSPSDFQRMSTTSTAQVRGRGGEPQTQKLLKKPTSMSIETF